MNELTAFFLNLTHDEQLLILELARQGAQDELMDGHMRLDVAEEILEALSKKLDKFMENIT